MMRASICGCLLGVLATSLPAAAEIDGFGIAKRRVYRQTEGGTIGPVFYLFNAYVEGSGFTVTSPFTSAQVLIPGGSRALLFEEGEWFVEEEIVSAAALASAYPAGTYAISAGGGGGSLSLAGAYPNVPQVTVSAGRWEADRLILTAEEAHAGVTISTNATNGNGFVSLDIYDEVNDEGALQIGFDGPVGPTLTTTVSSDDLDGGVVYVAEVEFDEVVDSVYSAVFDAWGYSLFSSLTRFEIFVERETLEVDFVSTGLKTGQFDFQVESGFEYVLMRSTDLNGGVGVAAVVGDDGPASLSFDDSGSVDGTALFWVEKRLRSAPAVLVSGEVIELSYLDFPDDPPVIMSALAGGKMTVHFGGPFTLPGTDYVYQNTAGDVVLTATLSETTISNTAILALLNAELSDPTSDLSVAASNLGNFPSDDDMDAVASVAAGEFSEFVLDYDGTNFFVTRTVTLTLDPDREGTLEVSGPGITFVSNDTAVELAGENRGYTDDVDATFE